MFGLTFEKIILIGVVAVFLLGPERLPHYAGRLARLVRQLRALADGAKVRMRDELGPDVDEIDWKRLDPRQYDPRRIIREALLDENSAQDTAGKSSGPGSDAGRDDTHSDARSDAVSPPEGQSPDPVRKPDPVGEPDPG
jgi:sec-independent protein translocase protein TatB